MLGRDLIGRKVGKLGDHAEGRLDLLEAAAGEAPVDVVGLERGQPEARADLLGVELAHHVDR